MTRPTLQHAETHSHYMPQPRNPKADEAQKLVASINETMVTDPATGEKLYPKLIDQLIKSTTDLAKTYDAPEPLSWSAAQRCVWRSSKLPHEHRYKVVEDRSLSRDVKAFARVNAGRWLVNCPFSGCNSAQYASILDRRYWCCDCENRAISGKWIEVIWPEVESVEAWMQNRPLKAKNWNPGETSKDIKQQDIAAKSSFSVSQNPNDWPKEMTLPNGLVVSILRSGTPEWEESQRESK